MRRGYTDCWNTVRSVSETVRFLSSIDRSFVLVSVHANNWWGAVEVGGRTVPEFLELSYINRDLLPHNFTCDPLDWKELNAKQLAFPNRRAAPEIAMLSPWSTAQAE